MKEKEISKKYELLDEIQHVLKRPGMYIGSTKPHQSSEYFLVDEKFEKSDIEYNPGFLKLFDEIVSNSVDESKRNSKLDSIVVTIDEKTNEISIYDNGGIPVIQHTEHKQWIPELIFSNLRAGSNFDDTQSRTVAGTNGVGSTLTNIFSKRFTIKTADGKNQFIQTFTENMGKRTEPKIQKSDKKFTEISYIADFQHFGMTSIGEEHIKMIRKRLIDIAASNPGLKITFNKEKFKFKSFYEYVKLYVGEAIFESSDNWEIAFSHSSGSFQSVSFVNSIETKDGGTHVNYIANQVVDKLRYLIQRKHKVEVKPGDIRNHLFLFVNSTIFNPAFSSQTKEKLITEPKDFGSEHIVSDKIVKKIFESEIVQSILDWIDRKKEAEERAQLRKLNKGLDTAKILKLIDAKSRTDRDKCSLGIFEGMSALSAVRKFRDPQTFGAFPLKGKFLNVQELKPSEAIKNREVVDLMGSLGLRLGEPPTDLRYGKILIYTDADPDGDAISALLINFFAKFWPELFEQNRIFRVMTPIVVAQKGKQTLSFYTNEDYKKWSEETDLKPWSIEYKKGLASLEDVEYNDIIRNPKTLQLQSDSLFKKSLSDWFGGDSQPRKEKLLKA
jgi:DNA topoisomerase-2